MGEEAKYVSGLSTIMVATIQEAKDRIAQIEYIFCSQLFPNFQSFSEREKSLLSQIQDLQSQNLALINDKEQLSKQLAAMPSMVKSLQDYIARLKFRLNNRSQQWQHSVELHTGLVAVLRVKGSDELNKDEIDMILSQVKGLMLKADQLSNNTLVTENLLKKAGETERKLSSLEEEKQRFTTRLQVFEENAARLQTMLRHKDGELKEGKFTLEAMGEEHKSYLADLEALRRQSEEKSSELALEMKKRKQVFAAYKNLKSQYNFLCKKFGLTTDSVPHQSDREDDDTYQSAQDERPAISSSFKRKHSEATDGADKVKVGTGSSINCEKERILKTLQTPNTSISPIAVRTGTGSSGSCEKESIIKTVQTPTTSVSPIVRSPGIRSGPSDAKTPQLSGSKRPASVWRETRSRQSPGGQDPHDDFLDTPVEKIKKAAVEEKNVDDAGKKDDSDDETQDMNPKASPSKQRIQVAEASKKGFKHVEAVRKKAERDNLKGIECKQCKKFYDAVLPENEGNGKGLRCEHHEGVSRHRYKYAPPMTPEGFWNIGFESEM